MTPAVPDPTVEALAEVWLQHAFPGEVNTALDSAWIDCECGDRVDVPVVDLRVSHDDVRAAFSAHVAAAMARVLAEHAERAVREALEAAAEVRAQLKPWGPYEMGGFEGCTDRDPEHCACATDVQPACRICDQEIEPGEQAWSRQWPCYDTLPLDHRDQDWDVISWHDKCPPAPTGGRP